MFFYIFSWVFEETFNVLDNDEDASDVTINSSAFDLCQQGPISVTGAVIHPLGIEY